eukprot:353927-Chlamydomonas_euryale.AAC.2
MYAQLCSHCANAKDATDQPLLPTFESPETAPKRIDFRRLLLNKCQDEFEKGIDADSAVKAREKEGPGHEVRATCAAWGCVGGVGMCVRRGDVCVVCGVGTRVQCGDVRAVWGCVCGWRCVCRVGMPGGKTSLRRADADSTAGAREKAAPGHGKGGAPSAEGGGTCPGEDAGVRGCEGVCGAWLGGAGGEQIGSIVPFGSSVVSGWPPDWRLL